MHLLQDDNYKTNMTPYALPVRCSDSSLESNALNIYHVS